MMELPLSALWMANNPWLLRSVNLNLGLSMLEENPALRLMQENDHDRINMTSACWVI